MAGQHEVADGVDVCGVDLVVGFLAELVAPLRAEGLGHDVLDRQGAILQHAHHVNALDAVPVLQPVVEVEALAVDVVEIAPLEAAPELVVPGQDPGALAAQQRVFERIGVALAVRDAPLRLAVQGLEHFVERVGGDPADPPCVVYVATSDDATDETLR